ncbi:hypothetical protein [Pseudomonas syringae]|uniref:hypothetical protein n=1 Tax=Pseudomonas syringae TaxID=317 RepID=UPI000404A702|nr:hypothetical protein [Pseudomonas syringae]
MPGVGTPFAEVGDLDYSTVGLAGAWFGEERINWGLLMLVDALRTWPGLGFVNGQANRAAVFSEQLKAIERPLRFALTQPGHGTPRLLGLKLYVYGFSRGAAAARAFVSWLNELMRYQPFLALDDLQIPLSVEYLGLLDTVASVGFADCLGRWQSGVARWRAGKALPAPGGEF